MASPSTSSYHRLNDDGSISLPPNINSTQPPDWRSIVNLFRIGHGDPGHDTAQVDRKRLRRLVFSYAPDWTVTIVLAATFFALDKVSGFKREFSVSDTGLRHPFAEHERVPDWALYLIAVVSPIILQWAVNLLTIRSWWDAHNSTLGVVLGLTLTGAITQFTKVTVGRPRPDLISRCRPDVGTVDPPYELSSVAICHPRTKHMINDGFRSFPSGHSSLSFAGLGFLAFYLAGKMHLFDKRGHALKAWIAITPLSGAALVAISRTEDYRHHWQDVLVGAILGLTMAYFAYRQYYPSLSSELSHRPYSPRVKRVDPILPVHRQDGSRRGSPDVVGTVSYSDNSDDGIGVELLAGTVRRNVPGPLRQMWKEGDDESTEVVNVANPTS